MPVGLQTGGAILNQMSINKPGLKEITPRTNCLVFCSRHLG